MVPVQRSRGRRLIASTALLVVLASGAWASPTRAEEPRPPAVRIAPGPLDQALVSLAAQTHTQLLYSPDLVARRRTEGLAGAFAPEAAIARLLGPGVAISRPSPNVLVIRAAAAGPVEEPAAKRPFGDAAGAAAAAEAAPTVEEVTVTGTHLRGAGAGASPVVRLERDDLRRSGHATLAAALQTLPQTFGGQSTEGTVGTRGDTLGTNAAYGTGVNLHGLGADATLILLNGRRLAGSGNRGDFVDLSSLPAIAVERVEVLTDGASAIYGSDAVAGVVNVILRRDLDGGEIDVRGGEGRGGDPREGVLGAVVGTTWRSGGALLAYEAYDRSALASAERSFTRSSDLRPMGGRDRRDTFSYPGNILRTDPATGVSSPYWAIPPGQAGAGLAPGDFTAGTRNLQNENVGIDVLPAQRRQSVYAAARQALTPDIEVSGDLRYAMRHVRAAIQPQTATFTVTRANPNYVSPVGAPSESLQYNFAGELPNPVARVDVETRAATLGAEARLPAGWRADAYAALAEERFHSATSGFVNSALLNEALGSVADNPLTAYSPARDGYFNPFTGVPSNPRAVLAAISAGYTENSYRNRVTTANLQADGSVARLGGGDLQVALGAQWRREELDRHGTAFFSTPTPAPQAPLAVSRDVAAVFAEARAPLFGPQNARPGLQALELSAAVRAERFDGFGSTVNPKAGVLWSPVTGLRLRATYGRSFRAPALQEIGDARINTPLRLPDGAGRILTLALQGANRNLGPETADTWTAGFEATPPQVAGLRLSATWFRTDFDNRIDRPGISNLAGVLTDPRLAAFVQRIDPAAKADDLALINRLLADPATSTVFGVFPATDYRAIVDLRYVNTSRLLVEGVDAQASLSRPLGGGSLALSLDASWIYRYGQQLTPTAPLVETSGRVGSPARLRARATATWTSGPATLAVSANATSGLKGAQDAKIGGQVTFDTLARWQGRPGTALAGAVVTLSVRNLFDRNPPFYDNPTGFGFEPGTGDPVGRFVALELSRSW